MQVHFMGWQMSLFLYIFVPSNHFEAIDNFAIDFAKIKVKRSRKDPFILDQIWFIFNKVTNYVKNITPELVSLKIGAFFLV